jgi:hypothetical protein
MRRVLVIGRGVFARAIAGELRLLGVEPVMASRHGALRVDVEGRASVLSILREYDVVVDTAGPFRTRTTTFVEEAIKRRCDVIDINEQLAFAEGVAMLDDAANAAGVAVFPSCSAVSVLTHALVVRSGLTPDGMSVLLLPATGDVASRATVATLLDAVVHGGIALRDGALVDTPGLHRRRSFMLPAPWVTANARDVGSADVLHLHAAWPQARNIDFWVDPGVRGAVGSLGVLCRLGGAVGLVPASALARFARLAGRSSGGLAVEVRSPAGECRVVMLSAPRAAHRMAAIPAALVAQRLAAGHGGDERGVIPPHRHVDSVDLFAALAGAGMLVSATDSPQHPADPCDATRR